MQKKQKSYALSYPKIVAIGFAFLILAGSLFLMLPISSKHSGVTYIDALFTATSATCITGLVPFDTYTNWSVFGQIVIICLIQIGGLGFITALGFLNNLLFKGKIGLKQKMLLKESVGSFDLENVKSLTKDVIVFTVSCELAGAVILAIRFVPLAGVRRGIYMALFTAVSAFCNAGFDLMGMVSPSSSLTTVNDDPVVLLTVSALIVFGGLGFLVWQDVRKRRFKFKTFSANTKLVIVTTVVLIFGGAVLFGIFEHNYTFKNMPWWQQVINALFCSITPRTAGFNSVDIGSMSPLSRVLTDMLMFIGGSGGSTAGGVKVTTVAVLVLCTVSNTIGSGETVAFGKRVDDSVLKRALTIVVMNFVEIVVGTFIICSVQNFSVGDALFECASAMGTVGITVGITPELNTVSSVVIILLMYVGRLTTLIFALSFVTPRPKVTTQKPKGNFVVG